MTEEKKKMIGMKFMGPIDGLVVAEIDRFDWPENMDSDTWLTSLGYSRIDSIGVPDETEYSIYSRDRLSRDLSDETGAPSYIVMLGDGNHLEIVTFDSLAELFNFQVWIAPMIAANQLQYTARYYIQEGIEKLFQAYHGHAVCYLCAKCDPDGYARQREWLQERAAKKKETP